MNDPSRNKTWRRAGLTAVILLAPGGFILGATLLARHWRARQESERQRDDTPSLIP